MPVTLNGSPGVSDFGSATTHQLNPPPDLVEGDRMVAVIGFGKGTNITTITMPSGWVQEQRINNGTAHCVCVYAKEADAADAAATSFQLTLDVVAECSAIIWAISGEDETDPVNHLAPGALATASTTVTYDGCTPTVDDCLLLVYAHIVEHDPAVVTDIPTPSGVSNETETGGGLGTGSSRRIQCSTQQLTGGASTTVADKTVTLAGAANSIGGMVAIAPASGGGSTTETLRPAAILSGSANTDRTLAELQTDVP